MKSEATKSGESVCYAARTAGNKGDPGVTPAQLLERLAIGVDVINDTWQIPESKRLIIIVEMVRKAFAILESQTKQTKPDVSHDGSA